MVELLLASGNPNKIIELRPVFLPDFQLCSLAEHALKDDHTEDGDTFHENSASKALYYSRLTDLPVVADDSGLIIDALNGLPGVRSARYPGADMPYPDRCRHILNQMREKTADHQRSARFICVASVARNGKLLGQTEGIVEGRISLSPQGEQGFGYDPIFFHPPSGCTFAQLSLEEKNRLSHRFRAFSALISQLDSFLNR